MTKHIAPKRLAALVLAVGVAAVLSGVAQVASAAMGPSCRGLVHQTQTEPTGIWVYAGTDCSPLDACPGGADCQLTVVPGTGNTKWRCGCDGVQDGTCDATESRTSAGTTGSCLGSCASGSCGSSSYIEWTDGNGVKHRTISCACS